jgi:nitrous oxide reductase accessory protein NosL
MRTTRFTGAGAALLLLAAIAAAEEPGLRPSPKDKCPVCGMFVSKYPDWTARVTFLDGGAAWFDGAKDLFKFLADPGRFLPGRKASDVGAVTFTDYYAVKPIDAKEAFLVVGSDVFGPMGKELVPFGNRSEAHEFLRDHKGKRVLRFGDVNRAVLEGLE